MLNRWHLSRAARTLHEGGVVAYPTEAVFGLGCDPNDPGAVLRILALKQRPVSKGLILIASRIEQLQPYLAPIPAGTRARLEQTWPGPVTWLLAAHPDTPAWLTGEHDSLAVRVTAHAGAAALCETFGGALVSTSANRSGRPPARSALGVRRAFGEAVDYILHGPTGGRQRPSEIRDGRSGVTLRP